MRLTEKPRVYLSKLTVLLLLAVIPISLCFISFGCTADKEDSTKETKKEKIRITGSGTCIPLLEIMTKEYEKRNPDVEFAFLAGAHSSSGIKGVSDGTVDIGSVSRAPKPEEEEPGMEYKVLSNDGLAIATYNTNPVSNLTSEQVIQIFSGEITNWKDIGGDDATIIVLDRAEDESAKMIIREFVIGDITVVSSSTVLFLESDMIKAVESTPDSIGYFSLGYAISKGLDLKLLSLDGIEPTVENINNGSYKIIRNLGVVYKANSTEATKKFVSFMQSEEGKKVMEDNGYASHK